MLVHFHNSFSSGSHCKFNNKLGFSEKPDTLQTIINPTTILEHHKLWTSSSYGATGKRGGSAAESSPQAIMPCRY
jgi:hypothetical protein